MASKDRWDQPWHERPSEEANNLNPAFCGELIFRAASAFASARKEPFGTGLSFLVLPMVLHKPTRDILPGNAGTAFGGWAAEHNTALAAFPELVARLAPVTKETLLFLLQNDILRLQEGALTPGKNRIRQGALPERSTADTDDARRAAALLGRWFARQHRSSLVMQAMGVMP